MSDSVSSRPTSTQPPLASEGQQSDRVGPKPDWLDLFPPESPVASDQVDDAQSVAAVDVPVDIVPEWTATSIPTSTAFRVRPHHPHGTLAGVRVRVRMPQPRRGWRSAAMFTITLAHDAAAIGSTVQHQFTARSRAWRAAGVDILRTAVVLIPVAGLALISGVNRSRDGTSITVASQANVSEAVLMVLETLIPVAPLQPLAALPTSLQPIAPVYRPTTLTQSEWRSERRSIQRVLNQFRDAMSVLDVAGVVRVWPGADERRIRSDFAAHDEQNVEFTRCSISGDANAATASCAGVIESGLRPGDRRPLVERTRWEFQLRKNGTRWNITRVGTSPG